MRTNGTRKSHVALLFVGSGCRRSCRRRRVSLEAVFFAIYFFRRVSFSHPTILKNGQQVPTGANWCQISLDGWKQDTRCATIWQQFSHERGERGCPTHTPESYSGGTILPRPVSGASMALCPFYQQGTSARTQCVFPPSSGHGDPVWGSLGTT